MPAINKLVLVVALVILFEYALPSLSDEYINHVDYGDSFIYHGFTDADSMLTRNGVADITSNGVLRLTNNINGTNQVGHVFYSHPLRFKINNQNSSSSSKGDNTSSRGSVLSFSTAFIFSIVQESPGLGGQGIAFVLAPRNLLVNRASGYLGLFNSSNNGDPRNHVLAVELDTIYNEPFDMIKGEHVGIDINGIRSVNYAHSRYYTDDNGGYDNLKLTDGRAIQVWIEYDGVAKKLNVTLAPIGIQKPDTPLLSYDNDLSDIILESMYVGFSSSTSSTLTSHCLFGWSFKLNGLATPFQLSRLPGIIWEGKREKKIFGVELPIIIPVLVLPSIACILFVVLIIRNKVVKKRKIRNSKPIDVVEDLEKNYGRLRFSYKDLNLATKGFKEKELLGSGGFGRVYKGLLQTSKAEVAVKRISHNSKQGIREFTAEITSIGHLRHRNLAHLLGYCRRNRELLLVYDFMPNGSLDKLLFRKSNPTSASSFLSWNQRFHIIKGVASGLIYLHEEWEQVVIHRDIKASNVLLDAEMNARLGDFGLARLYNRGTNPETTNVAGTFGYIAPEMIRTGKATTSSDVFAFGALLLEISCGRRPTELHISESEEGEILVDWVLNCWRRGDILQTSDPNLGTEFIKEEMELVLKLGLLCSHNDAKARPSMRQVMQYLAGELPLPQPESWAVNQDDSVIATYSGEHRTCTENVALSTSNISSVANSLLSGPR